MSAAAERLSYRDLVAAFSFATDWLGVHVDEVNALNVYPVPDGDTGTNMHMTLQSVRRQFTEEAPDSMAGFAHALSYGSLLGARGNSGVILSQILKGFADSVKAEGPLGGSELVTALAAGARTAYEAVVKPVEGTILTVVRRAAEAAAKATRGDPVGALQDALDGGHDALRETPEMLPILKQAGVVDAGGLGFLRLLEGLIAHFEGRSLPDAPVISSRAQMQFTEEDVHGFCTEFLLADASIPAAEVRELVQPFGDSLLVVGAEGFIKGHIHTDEPEALLALVARHGRMVQTKVEDMSEQHSEILAGVELSGELADTSGLVAVSDGYGITKAFRALGARVIVGGQTRNPSVQDIADAVMSVAASEVVILPNNGNVVPAALQVPDLITAKQVTVLPTRTLGQGLAAAVAFDPGSRVEDYFEAMREDAAGALTLEVTTATRTAEIEGIAVSEGSFIGLADGSLVATDDTAMGTLRSMLERFAADRELATLFHSKAVDSAEVIALVTDLALDHPDLEIEVQPGAPELYAFVMTLE